MFSGLTWERFPAVWLVPGRDVETASGQNHAAAETGKLHWNPLLPKLVFQLSAENMAVWFLALTSAQTFAAPEATHIDMPSSGEMGFVPCGPSLCLTNLNFFGHSATGKNSWECFSATLWFLNSQEFSTYCLSMLYSYQWRECEQVWGNAVPWTIFYQEKMWKLATALFNLFTLLESLQVAYILALQSSKALLYGTLFLFYM